MMLALKRGKKTVAIDFNSTAPAKATPGMFPLDPDGTVQGRVNEFGWLAAGVPGTLAGLQLALTRYGTRPFRELVAPAIRLAQDGFPITEGFARAIRATAKQLAKDEGISKLLLKDGEPLQAGDAFRNPDLGRMLQALADSNSVEPFYRGEIARRIADAFQKHGGLVTFDDMASYKAREVAPLQFDWHGFSVQTAPLTAGGLTVLQTLSILKALGWDRDRLKRETHAISSHAFVESLRAVWYDRLALLGDPQHVKIPIARLLSEKHAGEVAAKVRTAVRDGKPLPFRTDTHEDAGTVHLNAADADGNMVALTLTHGNAFGACVAVDGLGLILGHGMSRFAPQPTHPNSPGPRKRPLHNMCPTIVLRDGKPLLALGATGGRMIVNAVFNIPTHFVGLGTPIDDAVAAPRLHTDGNLTLTAERKWPEAETELLKNIGYTVRQGAVATAHAIVADGDGGYRSAAR